MFWGRRGQKDRKLVASAVVRVSMINKCYQNIQIKIEKGPYNREHSLSKPFLGAYLTPHNPFHSTLMTFLSTVRLKRLPEAYLVFIIVIL